MATIYDKAHMLNQFSIGCLNAQRTEIKILYIKTASLERMLNTTLIMPITM